MFVYSKLVDLIYVNVSELISLGLNSCQILTCHTSDPNAAASIVFWARHHAFTSLPRREQAQALKLPPLFCLQSIGKA
jgi:hypothetical protein